MAPSVTRMCMSVQLLRLHGVSVLVCVCVACGRASDGSVMPTLML